MAASLVRDCCRNYILYNSHSEKASFMRYLYTVHSHNLFSILVSNVKHRKERVYGILKDIRETSIRHYSRKFSFLSNIHINNRQSTGKFLICGLGIGLGMAAGHLPIKYIPQVAFCESSNSEHTRLAGSKNTNQLHKDAKFDWLKFFSFLRPEVWHLILAVASALVVAFLNVHIPVLLGDLVNVMSKFVKTTASPGDTTDCFLEEVKQPATYLICMYLLQSAFTFIYISILSISGERLACNLRKALFSSIIKQDISFFDVHKTGEVVSRLASDVQEFKSSFKLCIAHGIRSLAQVSGCIVSLYLISPKMTGVMVVVVPAIIATGTLIGSFLRKMSREAQSQIAQACAVADEAVGNIRTVRAFAAEDREKELYNQEVESVQVLNSTLGIGIGAFQGLANLALNGIVFGVLYTGGSLLSSNDITPGSLMSFLVATQTIQRSLAQLSLLFGQFVKGLAAGTRVFQYMDQEPTIPLHGGIILSPTVIEGEVEFKNVTFFYPSRSNQLVLQNFSLHIPSGKVVALCGLSGSGKSTVAALLERFYDTSSGTINLDGHDIKILDPSWLRGKVIGFINQEPVLFATSIMENIRYGRPDASDDEVREAAKLANADEFISSFPQGYDTVLGERGVTVSGGQKQRIAIARALIKNPSILILDEATSALDAESEKLVQNALDRVVKGRTVLVIAHRLSTIQNADVIAVLADGVIAEIGNHHSLIKKKGLYYQLVKHQQQMEENTENLRRSA